MAITRAVERAVPVAFVVFGGVLLVAAIAAGTSEGGFREDPSVTARAHAMPGRGWAPLTVHFSAYGSAGPSGTPLRYEWDLDGDGRFETDATASAGYAERTYVRPNTYEATLRVTTPGGAGATATTTVEARHPASSTVDYRTLFDQDSVGRIDLLVTSDAWDRMWADPPSKLEVEAAAEIFGIRVDRIGLSMKGNASLEASGAKKSWKLDLNEFVERQDFRGLTMLLLHNNFADPSMLRETLAYEMLRFAGANAGFTRFVEVWVDLTDDDAPPSYLGISTMVERPDRTFLGNRFGQGDDDGNLYKADAWFEQGAADLAYYGEDIADYPMPRGRIAYRKMPEGVNDDYSDIIGLTRVVDGEYASPEAWASELETVLEVDSFLRYLAATFVHLNLDTYPYTGNNYYLYHHPGTGRFEWIAWDENLSWGLFGGDARFPLYGTAESQGPLQYAPLYERVFLVDEYRIRYEAYVDLLLRHWFHPETFTATATRLHDLIAPYLTQAGGDRMYFGPTAMFPPEEFDRELDRLIELTTARYAFLTEALSRTGGAP